jgi:hypothetical protein
MTPGRVSAIGFMLALVLAVPLSQVLPDLSGRMQVIAERTYYYRQHLPNVSVDGP